MGRWQSHFKAERACHHPWTQVRKKGACAILKGVLRSTVDDGMEQEVAQKESPNCSARRKTTTGDDMVKAFAVEKLNRVISG